MRIPLMNACNLTAQGTNSNVGGGDVKWPGGRGVLRISSFNIIAGAPVIQVAASLNGIDILSFSGLPATISADGWYDFWAPVDTQIALNFQVAPGEAASLGEPALYTEK